MHILAERLRRVGKTEKRNNGNNDCYGRHRQETDEQPRLDGQVLFHYWPPGFTKKICIRDESFYAKKTPALRFQALFVQRLRCLRVLRADSLRLTGYRLSPHQYLTFSGFHEGIRSSSSGNRQDFPTNVLNAQKMMGEAGSADAPPAAAAKRTPCRLW
jgi:hypothetical protein